MPGVCPYFAKLGNYINPTCLSRIQLGPALNTNLRQSTPDISVDAVIASEVVHSLMWRNAKKRLTLVCLYLDGVMWRWDAYRCFKHDRLREAS